MYHYILYYNQVLCIMFIRIHHFTFFPVFAIIMLHRVAFLRKSSCRSATLFYFRVKRIFAIRFATCS